MVLTASYLVSDRHWLGVAWGIWPAWFWSPGWLDVFARVAVRARKTFDSSATPKAGSRLRQPRKLAAVDLAAVKAKLGKTIEQANVNDPRRLQRRIAELEKQLRSRTPLVDQAAVERAVAQQDKRWRQDAARAGKILAGLGANMSADADQVCAAAFRLQQMGRHTEASPSKARSAPAKAHHPSPAPATRHAKSTENLSKPQRAVLTALAQRQPEPSSKAQISLLSGYSIKSSSFANTLGALRSVGLMDGIGNALHITTAGLSELGSYDEPPTGRALIDWWAAKLRKAERGVLQVLVDAYPATCSKAEISEASGYSATSSSFANAIGKLRTLKLAGGYGDQISASRELMEPV